MAGWGEGPSVASASSGEGLGHAGARQEGEGSSGAVSSGGQAGPSGDITGSVGGTPASNPSPLAATTDKFPDAPQ